MKESRVIAFLVWLLMPWEWYKSKRLLPRVEKFEARMLRFREENGEPVPVERGEGVLCALLCLLVVTASLLTAGGGCQPYVGGGALLASPAAEDSAVARLAAYVASATARDAVRR